MFALITKGHLPIVVKLLFNCSTTIFVFIFWHF